VFYYKEKAALWSLTVFKKEEVVRRWEKTSREVEQEEEKQEEGERDCDSGSEEH